MEARDRRYNLALFAAAVAVWIGVAIVVLSQDPRTDPGIRYLAAALIGAAFGLTTAPLFWLLSFARQRRIAYRGDWPRALRRGGWVGGFVGLITALRLEDLFQLPIALFLAALIVVAEVSLSGRR
ncbi:MAG: hypothetical protein HY263_09170 [Chloroflexi bacterium]|nr:hypothetical protein [Chloroflexota bacterium]